MTPHQSMILRNGITPEKIAAMKASVERGKILIEKSRKLIERRELTFAQYDQMYQRAQAYRDLSDDFEWRCRWNAIMLRILKVMTNWEVFAR